MIYTRRSRALRLPLELFVDLRDILQSTFHEESTDYTVHKELRKTIVSCCSVSHRWYSLFMPLLYSNIYLERDDRQIALFRQTLRLGSGLSGSIRYLDIDCSASMSAYMIIVTRLPNLKALVVRNIDMVLIHPKLPSLLGCLPKTSELCFHLKIGLHEPMKYVVQLLQSSRPRTITVFSQCDNFVNIIHRSRNYKHILHIKLQLLQTVDLGVTQERLHIFSMTFQSLPDKLRSIKLLRTTKVRSMPLDHIQPTPNKVILWHETASSNERDYLELVLSTIPTDEGLCEMLERVILDMSGAKIKMKLSKGWEDRPAYYAPHLPRLYGKGILSVAI